MSGSFWKDTRKLDGLIKALGQKRVVQVGIFGNRNGRNDSGNMTNADLGAIHEGMEAELGSATRRSPARSWLRMPIAHESNQIVKDASAGAEDLLADGKVDLVYKRLGIAAENAIQRAFSTRGFGQWAPNADSTVHRKKSSAPLIDSGQFRRSVASRVVKA